MVSANNFFKLKNSRKYHALYLHIFILVSSSTKMVPDIFTIAFMTFMFFSVLYSSTQDSKFGCKFCGRHYTHKPSLYRHMRFECNTSREFPCEICKTSFKRKDHLLRHNKYVHIFKFDKVTMEWTVHRWNILCLLYDYWNYLWIYISKLFCVHRFMTVNGNVMVKI